MPKSKKRAAKTKPASASRRAEKKSNPAQNRSAAHAKNKSAARLPPRRSTVAHPPHPRMSLRSAMRLQGLDEQKITGVLRRQVNRLQRLISKDKLNAAQEKLLLEILKECAKILEPAARASAPQDSSAVQLVHEIPRPPREPSAPESSSPAWLSPDAPQN